MDLIKKMEDYAITYNIPIMCHDSMDYLCEYIANNQIKTILEIGTAIAYSTIRMASVNDSIHIVSIERDNDRYSEALKNVKEAKLEDRITLIHGDALETIIEGTYDLIFIDAAKAQYIKFFERYTPLLNDQGTIISDNLDFHGLVNHESEIRSRNLRALVRKIKAYVDYLENHPDFYSEYIRIGDGIAISKKRISF